MNNYKIFLVIAYSIYLMIKISFVVYKLNKVGGGNMNKLTFDDIMEYDSDNLQIFNELKKNIDLVIPFIGAGLSSFTYPLWSKFLYEIRKKISDRSIVKKINELIKNGELEKAASILCEARTKGNFFFDLKTTFDDEKLYNPDIKQQIYKEAVYILPLIFNGLILTTNYDKVIEHVFNIHNKVLDCGHPGQKEKLTTVLRISHRNTLYKFHGDISEIETAILTEESYNKAYAKDSDLYKELKECFKSKCMLFLGCSLVKDRTLNVLEEILDSGVYNYTITSCKRTDRKKKREELGERRILGILYPDKHHYCVRIILERILEIKNKDEYLKLPYYEQCVQEKPNELNRLRYDSEVSDFVGRQSELTRLKQFCKDDRTFLWWAITGEGGTGKSRLAFQFMKLNKGDIWDIKFIELRERINFGSEIFNKLMQSSENIKKNTVFIVDYALAFSQQLCNWILLCSGNQAIGKKIRILLIERNGKNYSDAVWIKTMENVIYFESNKKQFRNACFNSEEFLRLNPIEDKLLTQIIRSYAGKFNKFLSINESNKLICYLREIDPGLRRPLYALFIVDAWIDGINISKLNSSNILDYILEKEIDRIKSAFFNTLGKKNIPILKAYEEVLTLATMTGSLSISEVKIKNEIYKNEVKQFIPLVWEEFEKCIRNKYNNETCYNMETMLLSTGLVKENEKGQLICEALYPDIIGEYFVFKKFLEYKSEHRIEEIETLIVQSWNKPFMATGFIDRLIDKYFLESEEYYSMLVKAPNIDNKLIKDYLAFIIIRLAKDTSARRKVLLSVLNEIIEKDKNSNVNLNYYTKILAALVNDFAVDNNSLETVESFIGIMELALTSNEIIQSYTDGIRSLINSQNEENIYEIISTLNINRTNYSENVKIFNDFTDRLVRLGFMLYRKNDFERAAKCFFDAASNGNTHGAVNLAYIIRRREIQTVYDFDIVKVLSKIAANGHPFALVNLALFHSSDKNGWEIADNLVGRIKKYDAESIAQWWEMVACDNDAEGYLVLGWLFRHKLISYNKYGDQTMLLNYAARYYKDLPQWIYNVV